MDTSHFKQKLEAELALIQKQIEETERIDIDQSATEPDEVADRFEDEEEKEEEKATFLARRSDLEDALSRIESGTYGKCETCSKEIEGDRLEANPAARTCIEHE